MYVGFILKPQVLCSIHTEWHWSGSNLENVWEGRYHYIYTGRLSSPGGNKLIITQWATFKWGPVFFLQGGGGSKSL